jgi:hypothetical protein
MQARPLKIFRLGSPGYIAVEADIEEGRARLLLQATGSESEAVERTLAAELLLHAALETVVKERVIYTPRVGGVGCMPGERIDFILSDREGKHHLGLHALADVAGFDATFLDHLLENEPPIEGLTIVTHSSEEACTQVRAALQSARCEVEFVSGAEAGAATGLAVEKLWERLATPMTIRLPPRPRFPHNPNP